MRSGSSDLCEREARLVYLEEKGNSVWSRIRDPIVDQGNLLVEGFTALELISFGQLSYLVINSCSGSIWMLWDLDGCGNAFG